MPRNIERDKREADRRKNQLIEAGFRLFSQNGIETVSLQKVADAANVSPATMYKYFLTKEKLLIAISAKVWDEVWQEALEDPGTNHFEHFTAYQGIEFYADRMIALYKNRPEVLRFSGEYKTYMNRRGNMEDKQLREHLDGVRLVDRVEAAVFKDREFGIRQQLTRAFQPTGIAPHTARLYAHQPVFLCQQRQNLIGILIVDLPEHQPLGFQIHNDSFCAASMLKRASAAASRTYTANTLPARRCPEISPKAFPHSSYSPPAVWSCRHARQPVHTM